MDPFYSAIFLDAVHVKLPTDLSNLALAATVDGLRDILGLWGGRFSNSIKPRSQNLVPSPPSPHITSRNGDTVGRICVKTDPLTEDTGRVALRHDQHPDPVTTCTRVE